jgi:hypothetical protein|tara:strand:- start:367 stop:603 length:237 start_codon:yes stop_codon:yes gene_type:complete
VIKPGIPAALRIGEPVYVEAGYPIDEGDTIAASVITYEQVCFLAAFPPFLMCCATRLKSIPNLLQHGLPAGLTVSLET